MSPEAGVAARLRARIKKELPQVKARVRLQYSRGWPSIMVDIDADDLVDDVCEMAKDYCDDLMGVCINGHHWIYPDDDDEENG